MKIKQLAIILILFAFFASFVMPAPAIAASAQPTITVVKLTSPIKHGKTAKLIIKTTPGLQCNLAYKMPSGYYSTAKGLGIKYADKKGLCTWKWKIGSNTTPGTGQLIITVNRTVTLRKPIVIKT